MKIYTYDNKVLEILSETQYEVELHETTLDLCCGAVYTPQDINDIYGENFDCIQSGEWQDRTWHIMFYQNIINSVLDQLKTRKTASISLSLGCMENLMNTYNHVFKKHGFMYSHVKGLFVPWKESVKKEKPKVLSSVMDRIKTATSRVALILVMSKYKLQPFKNQAEIQVWKNEQWSNAIKMAFDNGITIQDILAFNQYCWISQSIKIQDDRCLEQSLNSFIKDIDRELVWSTFYEWVKKIS